MTTRETVLWAFVGVAAGTAVLLGLAQCADDLRVEEQQQKQGLCWPALLNALERVEAPATPEQAQQAIAREGAYGPLQIRQLALDDVNRQCGTNVKLEEVAGNRNLSRWVCVQYIRMHDRGLTYERAARTWNGGPRGPKKKATWDYWLKVREALQEQGVDT